MIKFYIKNSEVSPNDFSYNDGLNFSSFSKELEIKNFKIIISRSEFLKRLHDVYEVVKNEIKIDDETYNDTSDFSKVNYCSLEELLNKPKFLFEIFRTYLRDAFFMSLPDKNAKYVINDFTKIEVIEDIHLYGLVFVKN